MLNTPARLSLTAYIFLMEVSIYEVSEDVVPPWTSKQQKEFFLCHQSAAFQHELSALQRGFSNLPASSPINNDGKSELDDDELDDLMV